MVILSLRYEFPILILCKNMASLNTLSIEKKGTCDLSILGDAPICVLLEKDHTEFMCDLGTWWFVIFIFFILC